MALEYGTNMATLTIEALEARFGLRWVPHRMGAHALVFGEIRDVDPCVHALYPHCLVDHGDAPVWMIGWPAAFGLAEYLINEVGVAGAQVNDLGDVGARMLELGCGTAVAGVAAGAAGANVLCTDYDEQALVVARHNAEVNGCVAVSFARLDWYAPKLTERYPLIIGSEITYHEVAFEPLQAVLEQALAPGGRVMLSDIFRPQTETFLARCETAGWGVEVLRRVVHMAHASHAIRIAILSH